ncbi:hypothetical protein BDR26DRAFT_13113 [Obelidium mucronatum]|nr:hypothetical protein BDR26DRAFT_13113 [Obelidium mucronatum]
MQPDTLHVAYQPQRIHRGHVFVFLRRLRGFSLVGGFVFAARMLTKPLAAFYLSFVFVVFDDAAAAAAAALLVRCVPGIAAVDFAKQRYTVPYPQPDDSDETRACPNVVHVTHLPPNYAKEEILAMVQDFAGFRSIQFYGKYCYATFDNHKSASIARSDLRSQTNLVVTFAKPKPVTLEGSLPMGPTTSSQQAKQNSLQFDTEVYNTPAATFKNRHHPLSATVKEFLPIKIPPENRFNQEYHSAQDDLVPDQSEHFRSSNDHEYHQQQHYQQYTPTHNILVYSEFSPNRNEEETDYEHQTTSLCNDYHTPFTPIHNHQFDPKQLTYSLQQQVPTFRAPQFNSPTPVAPSQMTSQRLNSPDPYLPAKLLRSARSSPLKPEIFVQPVPSRSPEVSVPPASSSPKFERESIDSNKEEEEEGATDSTPEIRSKASYSFNNQPPLKSGYKLPFLTLHDQLLFKFDSDDSILSPSMDWNHNLIDQEKPSSVLDRLIGWDDLDCRSCDLATMVPTTRSNVPARIVALRLGLTDGKPIKMVDLRDMEMVLNITDNRQSTNTRRVEEEEDQTEETVIRRHSVALMKSKVFALF